MSTLHFSKIKKVALITPLNGDWTYDSYTILDGFAVLKNKGYDVEFFASNNPRDNHPISVKGHVLSREKFIKFARSADLIILFWSKKNTNFGLAEEINRWDKTIYIDGSELGNDNWRDFTNQYNILKGQYKGEFGAVDDEMLKKCLLYFRREKPYLDDIIPLPYGITSVYRKYCKPNQEKDIDFFCVWGQDEYPLMRRYAQKLLVDFCNKNGFSYYTEKTKTRDEFYEKLSRSRVGISIGGGGFDTARFWEILGNNCILLTEKIDIFPPNNKELNYKRIYQFNNLYDFQYQLERIGEFLRQKYNQTDLDKEYSNILSHHSSEARVVTILEKSVKRVKNYAVF